MRFLSCVSSPAAIALLLIAGSAAFAQEAVPPTEIPEVNATLNLTLQTETPKPETKPAAKTPAKKATPPAKPAKKGRYASMRKTLPLPSRSATAPRNLTSSATGSAATAGMMLGRLGVVSIESATLRAGRTAQDKPLSIVTKDTNLAIVSETEEQYGVMMADSTVGWITKEAVQLLDYQLEIKMPSTPIEGGTAPRTRPTTEEYIAGQSPRTTALFQQAFSYLGVPYVWAGNTRNGIDCSGFVKNVFATQGIRLPRHSGDQISVGTPVLAADELQPGDRLYFDMKDSGRISHCGIYLGNGYFIHASSNQGKVGVDSLIESPRYLKKLVAARHD